MTEQIIVLDPISPASADRLRALLPPGMALDHAHARDPDHLQELVAGADYLISGQVPVDGSLLRAARKARLLHKWGVGVDNFDLDAARTLGIKVARTTGSNAVPVAEFTIGLIIGLMRNLAWGHATLREGHWRTTALPKDSLMLTGKTVGIVGFGAIGQSLARLLQGFRCRVLYNKRTALDASAEAEFGATYAAMPDLLREADVVTLNCPLTPETTGLIDRAALRTMKRTAVLINVARGGVVVEADLAAALDAGEILGAATDVYEIEPAPPGHPLLGRDNVVATPHLAALAADNFEKTVRQMFGNIERVARGEPIPARDLVIG